MPVPAKDTIHAIWALGDEPLLISSHDLQAATTATTANHTRMQQHRMRQMKMRTQKEIKSGMIIPWQITKHASKEGADEQDKQHAMSDAEVHRPRCHARLDPAQSKNKENTKNPEHYHLGELQKLYHCCSVSVDSSMYSASASTGEAKVKKILAYCKETHANVRNKFHVLLACTKIPLDTETKRARLVARTLTARLQSASTAASRSHS